jgi:hypothetical protein
MRKARSMATALWIFGSITLFYLLVHVLFKTLDLIMWLVSKGVGLMLKGWAWHRQKGGMT